MSILVLKLRAFLLLHTLSIVFKLRTSCLRTPNILFEKSEHLVLDMQNSSVASRVNLQRRAPSLGAFFVFLPQRRLYFSKNVAHSSSNSPHVIGDFSPQSWATFPNYCASLPLASLLYAAYCPRKGIFHSLFREIIPERV